MEPGQLERAIAQILNSTDLLKLGAHGGSKYLGILANVSLNATSFYVREDTTVTVLTGVDIKGTTTDFLAQLAISGITLKAGDLYILPSGSRVNSMTITAGSVIVYS